MILAGGYPWWVAELNEIKQSAEQGERGRRSRFSWTRCSASLWKESKRRERAGSSHNKTFSSPVSLPPVLFLCPFSSCFSSSFDFSPRFLLLFPDAASLLLLFYARDSKSIGWVGSRGLIMWLFWVLPPLSLCSPSQTRAFLFQEEGAGRRMGWERERRKRIRGGGVSFSSLLGRKRWSRRTGEWEQSPLKKKTRDVNEVTLTSRRLCFLSHCLTFSSAPLYTNPILIYNFGIGETKLRGTT